MIFAIRKYKDYNDNDTFDILAWNDDDDYIVLNSEITALVGSGDIELNTGDEVHTCITQYVAITKHIIDFQPKEG